MSITLGASSSYTSGQGIDVSSTVDQIIQAESAPETAMKSRQAVIQQQIAMLKSVNTQLNSLGSAVTRLRDVVGPLSAQSATSTDTSKLTLTASNGAQSGSHLVEVTALASTASTYTDSVAADKTLSGTFGFTVAGSAKSITIDSKSDTVSELASTLSAGDYGVTANVLHDSAGDKLVLTSHTAGAAGAITNISSPTGLSFHDGSAAQDASFSIDGVPFTSATNSAAGMLPGVTLSLLGKTSTPVKISVGPDESQITQAIQNFVSAYNTVIGTINDQFRYDASDQTVGTLAADSSMRVLQSALLGQISTQVEGNGSLTTLRSLGVEMGNDGKLTVNSSVLSTAIGQHTADFKNFFQTAGTGFASKFGDLMLKLNNTSAGLLYVDINGLTNTDKNISRQIDDFDARLESRRAILLQRYSTLDAELRQMPILLNQISSQLAKNSSNS